LKGVATTGTVGTLLSAVGTTAARTSADVSKAAARKIAREAVDRIGSRSEFDGWRRQGVRPPEPFYAKVREDESVRYEPRAWVFPIESRGTDDGYIAIDATQTDVPVLAYGANEAPQRRLGNARAAAKASGNALRGRFLYHGGVEFGVETTDGRMAGLRGAYIREFRPVNDVEDLRPEPDRDREDTASRTKKGDGEEDWSGSTDDEVSGVPNWTETDPGGASSTDFGTGADSWSSWDGCVPIAGSMVVGYHEGIDEDDDEAREALIDRLHVAMDTSHDGVTSWSDCPDGIEDYSQGDHSYSANNRGYAMKSRVKSQISNDNPVVLNMRNSPFTAGEDAGHSVCGIGYREESCGWFCSDLYHKVYNGWYDENPDMVAHGNWENATVTKVTTQ
jgi:hypothetical protein